VKLNSNQPLQYSKNDIPLVTIVTPSFNQGSYIERTILSVLKQDYPKVEYFVLDSLSNDETSSILNKYESQITKVIREKDKGQGDAINKGFSMGHGEILAYLNADDCYSDRNVISRAVKALQANPNIDLVYGQHYVIDENGMYVRSYPFRDFDPELIYAVCFIPQECCFWTKEIYEIAGGYVSDKHRSAMDYDLWLRFLKNGATFLSVNDVFGLYRYHQNSKTASAWFELGFPEARDIQKKYAGRGSSVSEMLGLSHQHVFGVDTHQSARAALLNDQLWDYHFRLGRVWLGNAPLDNWVYREFESANLFNYCNVKTAVSL
jgi:glycosyltransferase involved in cell wall biosynthesis